MFGSGLSRPYLPVLGEIESRLTQLSHDATIGKDERKIIETAIYKYYCPLNHIRVSQTS